jgi:hypothetical protein
MGVAAVKAGLARRPLEDAALDGRAPEVVPLRLHANLAMWIRRLRPVRHLRSAHRFAAPMGVCDPPTREIALTNFCQSY